MTYKNWICDCGQINDPDRLDCSACRIERLYKRKSNYYKEMMKLGKEIKKKSGGGNIVERGWERG